MMKIALYYPWIYLKGGPERSFLELIRRSRHEWTIFTSHYDPEGTFPEFKSLGVVEQKRVSVRRRYGSVARAAGRIALTKLDLSDFGALVIGCDGLGSLLNFRNSGRPIVCLCFTPLRAVYDQDYRARHLEKHRRLLPLCLLFERLYRPIDRMAWNRYDRVFCISDTVRQRVLRGRLCGEDRLDIAYPGIDGDRIKCSTFREPFFFLPGRIMWTKNIELGIESFIKCSARNGDQFRLVIAGMVDAKSRPYYDRLRRLVSERPQITFVPEVTDAQMHRLYETCYATLFTAFNEDWGLTPLEAMMHGKPVIAVDRGGPTETVVHGRTGLLAPCDSNAFSSAMQQLIDDPGRAEGMGRAGLDRARLFTWKAFAEKLDSYFDSLAGRG